MDDTARKTNRRRRTQAERRDESERALVRAAVALVSEEGVSASTFEAIARRSGYSRGLVGQRFGSKLGLIEAVITYLHDGRESFAEARKLEGLPRPEALPTYSDHHRQQLSHMGQVR